MGNKKISFSFKGYADTITEIITDIILPKKKSNNEGKNPEKSEKKEDNPEKEDFFSIAIFGSWGSGKTTLINQINKNLLNQKNENLLNQKIKIINFDAFSSACSCKKSVLLSLLNEIMNSIEADEEYKEKFYPIIKNDNGKKIPFFNKLYAVLFFPIAYVCFKLDRVYISIPAIFNSIYQGEIKLRAPGNIFEYSLNLNKLYLNYYKENSEYNEKLFQNYLGNIISSWLNDEELYKNARLNSLKDNDNSFFKSKKDDYYSIWLQKFFLSDLVTKIFRNKISSVFITAISIFIFYILLSNKINPLLENTLIFLNLKPSSQVLLVFLNIIFFFISFFVFIPYLIYEVLTHNKLNHNDEINDNNQEKLVIFVDNIDRCDSNEIITFVKALGSLFRIDNCLFIVAFDKERILKIPLMGDASINNNDKNSSSYFDSNEYLKKIFKQCFYLPDKYQENLHSYFNEHSSYYFNDILLKKDESLVKLLLRIICHITTNIRTIEFLISQYCFEIKLLKKLKIIKEPDSKENKTEFIYYILILYLVVFKNWDNIKDDKDQDDKAQGNISPDIENRTQEFSHFDYDLTKKIRTYFSELRFCINNKKQPEQLKDYRILYLLFNAYEYIINTIRDQDKKIVVKDNRLKFLLLFQREDLKNLYKDENENIEDFKYFINNRGINKHFEKLKKIIYLDPSIKIESVGPFVAKDSLKDLKDLVDILSLISLLIGEDFNIAFYLSEYLAIKIRKKPVNIDNYKDEETKKQLQELIFDIYPQPTADENLALAEKIIDNYIINEKLPPILNNLHIAPDLSKKLAKDIIKKGIDLTKRDEDNTKQLAYLIFNICNNPTPEDNWSLAEKIINDYNS